MRVAGLFTRVELNYLRVGLKDGGYRLGLRAEPGSSSSWVQDIFVPAEMALPAKSCSG